MLRFIMQKMRNKKWMVASLLIGNILLITIASGSPMYTAAVLQRVATQTLDSYLTETGKNPGSIVIDATLEDKNISDGALEQVETLAASLPDRFDLPVLLNSTQYSAAQIVADPLVERTDSGRKELRLAFMTGLEEHSLVKSGSYFSEQPAEKGVLNAVVSERTLEEQNFLIGEEFTLPAIKQENGEPYILRISGVFQADPESADFWEVAPESYKNRCFISEEQFREVYFSGSNTALSLTVHFHTLLDYREIKSDRAAEYLDIFSEVEKEARSFPKGSASAGFTTGLNAYVPQAQKLEISLLVLQIPIYILLGTFLFMVSKQMLDLEENEIAVIKSRGSSKKQILTIYLLQSSFLALISLVIGIPLGLLLCQVIGASNAFLEFVRRAPLPVTVTPEAIGMSLLGALLSICAMVLPAVKHANVTIVSHKQKRQKRWKAPWWQKCFLDVVLIAVSLYGLYSFESTKELLAAQAAAGRSLDPLLYFSSSLFIIGAGLLALRLIPLLTRFVFWLGKRLWSPALYASFLRVMRTRSGQGFLMLFLIFTISLGIFNAQAARTINQNGEEQIRYEIGADIVLQEVWRNNAGPALSGMEASMQAEQNATRPAASTVYYEPDFNRYLSIEGVEQATRVLRDTNVTVRTDEMGRGSSKSSVTLLGIHTKEFGETAWMKDDLLPVHWYSYLNAISQNPNAVLLSSNFQTDYGLKTGDSITYLNKSGNTIRGVIAGFVDYWPSYAPVIRTQDADGQMVEQANYLIVANLAQVQSAWGITPYEVWLKLEDSSRPVYDFIADNGITLRSFRDAQQELTELKNDPLFQGTNGNLTVGFIVVLVLCTAGFLIFWILSIQSRVLQFGIFRAMGMTLREVISMLITEQVLISGTSIAAGVLIGNLVAKLFVPVIQVAYSAADQVLPLEVVSSADDSIRLFVVIAAMIVLCMCILGVLISKIKISQALKLGED